PRERPRATRALASVHAVSFVLQPLPCYKRLVNRCETSVRKVVVVPTPLAGAKRPSLAFQCSGSPAALLWPTSRFAAESRRNSSISIEYGGCVKGFPEPLRSRVRGAPRDRHSPPASSRATEHGRHPEGSRRR